MGTRNMRKFLEDGYARRDDDEETRHAYLASHIFEFSTYDDALSDKMGKWAVEVCSAISKGETFDFIKAAPENYEWYIIMCNLPFFKKRIEWGTSIRGAWWDHGTQSIESCGLWDGERQITERLRFNRDDWNAFVQDMMDFSLAAEPEVSLKKNGMAP